MEFFKTQKVMISREYLHLATRWTGFGHCHDLCKSWYKPIAYQQVEKRCHEDLEPDERDHMEQNLQNLSYLIQREIQMPLMANLLKDFITEIGYDKTMEIANKTIQRDAVKSGRKMAEKYGGNGTSDLLRVIREVWAQEKALEFTVLEETASQLRFNVTRCRYAELYDRLGIKEFGYCFSCNRDEPLIKAFNSRMKLLRTQTIMEGDTICDFLIVLE